MPMQKSQLHRLMRIAALLKENRYPNSETLVKEFRRIAVEEDIPDEFYSVEYFRIFLP